ncbi:MAG: RNA polymerase sigma-54 subunit [Elusimicrobia bacterium]|nr:MAG: RNA polymerase sigma-54 subunit [Elusimicrobiota bacterium]KAF0153762.1 MAG: RNA polymerase sigma-54 subunit [Elusimicrobiota bacterium]
MAKGMRAGLYTGAKASAALMGALKLAQLAGLSEEEFEKQLAALENNRFFQLLRTSGALRVSEYPAARYAALHNAGRGMKLSAGGLPELEDGRGDLVGLIQGIGQENFETWFLRDGVMSDADRARECGISEADAARLRDFVNRVYMQAEFEAPAAGPESAVFSAVAVIDLEDGIPVLAFFHREIWKGSYKVDNDKLSEMTRDMPLSERDGVEKVLKRVEFAEKRKTTLYRALEILISVQADYLRTGEPGRRRPLSQKTLAKNLEVHPSVLNRLVSNKSIRMPWGMEAPMITLLPTSKRVNLERLCSIAGEHPSFSDEKLRAELRTRHGVDLSRRSVAQYRKDMAIACSGAR